LSDWNATQYDHYAAPRQQAALDLVNAVPRLAGISRVTDLGCGSGLSTALLAGRWPNAKIVAVDQSPDMLTRAAQRVPDAQLTQADIATYTAAEPQDLILANASLHWLPAHQALFPRLLQQLEPGGVLAVQMPNNLNEPSHRLMRDVAAKPAYAAHLAAVEAGREPLLAIPEYYDLLIEHCSDVQIWETCYHHVLASPEAILDWFSSTGLRPFLDALPKDKRAAYRADYLEALAGAYSHRSDGNVLLRMPRLFIVATRKPQPSGTR
jgi:trans-aconitate 2-methyltransferase